MLASGSGESPPRLRFFLPLEPARLLRARQRIRDYLHGLGIEARAVDDVVLALQEAMTNAVRHSGSSRELEVCVGFDGPDLVATVKDHGRGFDITTFDPEQVPDLEASGGRGLYLIARLMDELELERDGGLEVHMTRRSALTPAVTGTSGLGAGAPGSRVHSEVRERELLEEIEEGFFALDWEYRFTFVNSAAERLWGRSREQHVGRTVTEVYPRIPEPALRMLREAMELGIPSQTEVPSPPSGRWREYRAYPSSFGLVAYVRDVDERKRKELERDEACRLLDERDALLRSTFEQDAIGVAHLTPDGHVLQANARLSGVLGRQRQEIEGSAVAELVDSRDRRRFDRSRQGLQCGLFKDLSLELRFLHGGGRTVWAEVTLSLVSDNSGVPLLVVMMVQDVSERKKAQAALRESEQKYRAIVETTAEGVMIGGLDGTITFANQRMAEMLGYRIEELEGMPGPRLFDEEWLPRVLENRLALHAGEAVRGEIMLRRKDGSPLWTAYSASPLLAGGGVHVGNLTVHSDVTERRRAEEELRALYEAQQHIATTLQEQFVHPLPRVSGLELAALSQPATAPELVGGDFHDVFRVADNRVIVLIGDVMGKGIEAAGLTETVRSAVRALALVTGSPAKILRHVNRLLLGEEHEQFVSALLLVFDPQTGRGALASAGHPPPVLVDRDGASFLEPPHGPLLGLLDALYQVRNVNLAVGETLVLYTDGLTEARCEGELFGEQRLLEALAGLAERRPEAVVARLREMVLAYAGRLQDDLELLALCRQA